MTRDRKAGVPRTRARFLPHVDLMEDRTLLSTLTVTNNHDSGPGSLRAEIAAAAGGDTINFSSKLRGETITLTSGELLITESVTINGLGASRLVVSGNNASRVFEIAAGQNVTISGLTITDGSAADLGGGILNDGSNLTLSADDLTQNVTFEMATDSAQGGGLESLGGSLTVSACQITGNQAQGGAGASAFGDAFGGGMYVSGGSATISNSTISGNLAQAGDNSSDGAAGAGGIFASAPTSLTGCTVSDNVARGGDITPDNLGYGGGLWIFPSSTTFEFDITGSTFSGNQAIGGNGGTGSFVGVAEGGAIQNYGGLSIFDSTFDHNQAIAGSDGNSGPSNAGPFVDYGFGGAIANTESTIRITGSTFSHNEAVGGNNATATDLTDIVGVGGAEGGALYTELGSTATVGNSTFDFNEAQGGNGNTGSGSVVLVGEGLGGAIISGYGGDFYGPNTLTVTNCTVTRNSAQGGNNNSGVAGVSSLVGAGAGAGIANYAGGTVSLSRSELEHGKATGGRNNTAGGSGVVFADLGAGGGFFNYLGTFNSPVYGLLTTGTISLSNSTLDHNQALGGVAGNGEGGGIANVLDAVTAVNTSTITDNQARGGGGGLGGGAYNDASSSLALTDCSVTQNQAIGLPGIGGGIFTLGTFSYDPFTVIDDNDASTSGDNIGP